MLETVNGHAFKLIFSKPQLSKKGNLCIEKLNKRLAAQKGGSLSLKRIYLSQLALNLNFQCNEYLLRGSAKFMK